MLFFDIHINHVSLAKRSLVNAANYRVANVSGKISKLAFFPPRLCCCLTSFRNKLLFYPNHSHRGGMADSCIVVKSRRLTGMFPGPNVSLLPVLFTCRWQDGGSQLAWKLADDVLKRSPPHGRRLRFECVEKVQIKQCSKIISSIVHNRLMFPKTHN